MRLLIQLLIVVIIWPWYLWKKADNKNFRFGIELPLFLLTLFPFFFGIGCFIHPFFRTLLGAKPLIIGLLCYCGGGIIVLLRLHWWKDHPTTGPDPQYTWAGIHKRYEREKKK